MVDLHDTPAFGDRSATADGLEELRRDLVASLPGLLDRAIVTYGRFATETPPEDSKGFVAYQAGCRAALAHVHLLVKLAHWARAARDDDIAVGECEQLDRLVREAEAALDREPTADD